MAFDEILAGRVRELVSDEPGLAEKKMFGGLGMLINGNMAVGVHGDGLIVRVDPAAQDKLLAMTGARVFDMTGRPMRGWLVVEASACRTDTDLRQWVDRGLAYGRSLPAK